MFNFIKELLGVMTKTQRKKLYILQVSVVFSAIFEVVGVLSIGPFMAMVGNIDIIKSHALISAIYLQFGFESPVDFLAATGFLVLGIMFLAAFASIVTIWKLSIFAAEVGAEFGDRLYQYYMQKDYLYHASTNSADLTKKIATEVNRITDNILQPLVQINARISTVIFISAFVFIYNPYVAISGVFIMSIAYLILYSIVKNKLSKNGQLISEYSKKRFSLMSEGFGSLKEVQILGREKFFVDQFKESGKIFAEAYGTSNGLYNMPRYLMEFIIYSSMIGLVLLLLKNNEGQVSAVLPVMGVFGIAALKLLPSFQQMYSGAAQIRSNQSAFLAIKSDLSDAQVDRNTAQAKTKKKLTGNVELLDAIFCYQSQKEPALNNINMKIPFKSSIGIVGPSGSGKSTILDVLIGAIKLDHGELRVNKEIVNDSTIRSWRNSIGYVSQVSLLKDGSIAENIALGINTNEIEWEKISYAAEMAQLLDWVELLPNAYDTQIGERGLQISGGQRQRIAIARALYNDAEYLFFDEATSALDGITEKNIMESIESMAGLKTIVMIAHRLNTVKECDYIYVISGGRVEACGTYQYLMQTNKHFNEMAGVHK